MSKANLTAGRVEAFKCVSDKQEFLWDSQVNGLAVRAAPGGRKSYILQTRYNSKVMRLTIGDVTAWAIEEARDKDGNLVLPGRVKKPAACRRLLTKG